jgi:beta-1,4-mannosyl-glycoprotein beta-1,4-N-acetylglucosaminyltransferase
VIYSGFTYNGEWEALLIHLYELDSVADYFVLVEGDKTFTGQRKEHLYYHNHHERWLPSRFRRRIIPVYAVLPDVASSPWERETYQRNSILLGLGDARKDDVLLMGDGHEPPPDYEVWAR